MEAEAKFNMEKDQRDAAKKADQTSIDSAALATPAPAATFPIQR